VRSECGLEISKDAERVWIEKWRKEMSKGVGSGIIDSKVEREGG
jgi:hypothetical protein